MNRIFYNYSEVVTNKHLLDKCGNHIIIANANESISTPELESLFCSIQNAEVNFHVDLSSSFSREFIDFCKARRLILYFDMNTEVNDENFGLISMFDTVALINISDAEKLSEEKLDFIVNHNINVCILDKNIDFQRVVPVYEKLMAKGFVRIFNVVPLLTKDNYYAEPIGFITRSQIENFNINQNIMVINQLATLRQNAMKRYNRLIGTKTDPKIEVLLVNVNINLLMRIERKNLGIEYLVSVLKRDGYNADTLYCSQLTIIAKIEKLIQDHAIKVIGFSCMQDNIQVVMHVSQYLKEKYPHISLFVGGAQAVALKEDFLKNSGIDYIMVGESENNITKLMDYIVYSKGNIEDVCSVRYIDMDGNYQQTDDGELINNLDNIPFPDYIYKSDDSLIVPGLLTGRGCPFNCAFCYEGAKEKTVRYRSLNNVFEEISILLKNNRNIRVIQIYDDTFTLNVDRVREFCDRFRELRKTYKVGWICEIHCQTVYDKPELINYMVESGLEEAQIGIESGNEAILKRFNKKITPEMIEKTVEHCKKAGLFMLEGNILLGGAGETKEQLEVNFEFVEKLLKIGRGMLQIYPVMFWPFVKTPITTEPTKYGVKIIPEQMDYTIYCIGNCVSESETVKRQEFIDHSDLLLKRIDDISRQIAYRFTAKDAKKYWKNRSFSSTTLWGRLLAECKYMHTYFSAKDRGSVDISQEGVYPIRTFNMLSYKGEQLYLKETDLLIDLLDSRILELCNGKNTGKDIAIQLGYDVNVITERLKDLEDKMLLFASNC